MGRKENKIGKTLKFLILCGAVFIGVLCICAVVFLQRTDMKFAKEAKVNFKYGDTFSESELSDGDLALIIRTFDNKRLYCDAPSCGFTENASLIINGDEIFCIACDSCPVVYWKNKNRYFNIPEKEYIKMKETLESYGFLLPRV